MKVLKALFLPVFAFAGVLTECPDIGDGMRELDSPVFIKSGLVDEVAASGDAMLPNRSVLVLRNALNGESILAGFTLTALGIADTWLST